MSCYLEHRREVVLRRTRFLLRQAEIEAEKLAEQKAKAVEILVPDSVKAVSNQDTTPTPAVVPITETPSGQV